MELDLKKLFTILWKKAWIIAIAFIIGAVSLFLYSTYFITPLYTASATLYVANNEDRARPAISTSDIVVAKELVNTCIIIIKSNSVLDKVAEETALGYESNDIRRMITAGSITNTEVFSINVTNPNREHAKILCNSITAIAPDEITRVIKAGSVEIVDPALLPKKQSYPDVPKNTVLGAIIALILSVVIILFVEIFDTRIKSESDLTNAFDLPIIGVVPSLEQDIQKLRKGRIV